MDTVVIRDYIDARNLSSWVCGVQQGQEIPKQPVVFTRTAAMQQLAGGEIECPSQIVFLVRAWRHDFFLGALEHPGGSDLRQEVDIEFIRKDHHLMRLQ